MKSRYAALLWEQLRICRLPCIGIFLSLLAFLLVDALGDDLSRLYGIMFFPEELAIFSLIVAGILIVLRREGQNRHGVGFQNRLLALPVSTFGLFCAVLGVRVLCLLLSGAIAVTLALYSDADSGRCVLVPLLLYRSSGMGLVGEGVEAFSIWVCLPCYSFHRCGRLFRFHLYR